MTGTGYTYTIKDGICKTPKEFLKLCLKAFGCCVELRDESLANFNAEDFVKEIKNKSTSNYLTQSLDKTEKELDKLLKKTDSDWKKELESKIANSEKKLEEGKKTYEEESKLLSYFTSAVENWNCSSKYQNIKNFALEQLGMTKADDYEWEEKVLNSFKNMDVKEYRNSCIRSAIKEVDYYKERIEGEKKRRNETIEFIEGFLKEIENI